MDFDIPPRTLMSILFTVMIVVVFVSVVIPILTGSEVRSWTTISNEINNACASPKGTVTQFSTFMPATSGNTPNNLVFFYLVADNGKFILGRLTYGSVTGDLAAKFSEWVKGTPGDKVIREQTLKNCKGIQLCGSDGTTETCNTFRFASTEGNENIMIMLNKVETNKLVITYGRLPVCGDHRCCTGESDINSQFYCKTDCDETSECQIFTA